MGILDFISMILDGADVLTVTPDDIAAASAKAKCWIDASIRARERRIKLAISLVTANCQDLMKQSEIYQALCDSGVVTSHDLQETKEQNWNPDADDDDDDDGGVAAAKEEAREAEEKAVEAFRLKMEMEKKRGGLSAKNPTEDMKSQVKLVASHFQVLGGTIRTLGINVPGALASVQQGGSTADGDLFTILAIDCASRVTFVQKMDTWLFVPLFVILVLAILYVLVMKLEIMEKEKIGTLVWSNLMVVLFIVYPMLCTMLLGIFNCQEVDGAFWLASDMSIECYSPQWNENAIISIIGIFLFPIGVPLLCYVLLSRNRHKMWTEPKFSERFGFIFLRYEEETW